MNKICCMCKKEKDYVDFYKDHRKKDGLYSRCKSCVSLASKQKVDKQIKDGLRAERQKNLSEEDKEKIIELYKSGKGSYVIAKEMGFAKITILRFLRKENMIRKGATYRKYKFKNENFFDEINSNEKAYFLGLLFADSYNYRNNAKGKQAYQIIVSLQEEDRHILSELANRIFENDDILRYVDKSTDYDNWNRQNQYTLRIPSKHISDVLMNYGLVPNKSFILEFPKNIQWTEDLLRSFILGFYDGNGGIYFSCGQTGVGITSTIENTRKINEIIGELFGKCMSFSILNRYASPLASIKFHGNQQCKKFLDWLYQGSTVKLDRKYKKYLQLIEMLKN